MAADRKSPQQTNFTELLPIGSKQRAKLKSQLTPRLTHGGAKSVKKRKTARPFSPGAPVHLVLKSKRAKGSWSLLHRKNQARVNAMIYVYAHRFKVKVYRAANVGNHLHLLLKASEKKHLADYLRVLAGRVAVTVSGAQKGVKKIGRFWDYLYWSRLVNWGRDFYYARRYVSANELEQFSKEHRDLILGSVLVDEWNDGPKILLRT
jgi:REP element-mobilizing transposase RayT